MNRKIISFTFLGKIIPVLLVVIVLASACSPVAIGDPLAPTPTTKAPMPTIPPTTTPDPQSSAPVDAVKLDLAKMLGIDISKITVLSQEAVEWSDSCLGVSQKDVFCAQVITPGFKIVLEAEGYTYEYHTDQNGSAFVRISSPVPGGQQVAFTYQREGGIAGFCDDVTVYASGKVIATSCKSSKTTVVSLTAAQRAEINQWLKSFKGITYDHTDPATADAMTIKMKFFGEGPTQPSDADIQSMLAFLSKIAVQ